MLEDRDKKELLKLLKEDIKTEKEAKEILEIIIKEDKLFKYYEESLRKRKFKELIKTLETDNIEIYRQFIELAPIFKQGNPEIYRRILGILSNMIVAFKNYEKYFDKKNLKFFEEFINEIYYLLKKELKVSNLKLVFLEKEQYQKIYNTYFKPNEKTNYFSPVFSDPIKQRIYILKDYFDSKYIKYIKKHESEETKLIILGYKLLKYYKHVPSLSKEDRYHEIATYKEFLYAKRKGELDKYYTWMKKQYEKDISRAPNSEEKEKIKNRWKIKEKMYNYVKNKRI